MEQIGMTNQKNSKVHSVSEAKRKWEQSEKQQNIIHVKLLCKSIMKSKCVEYLNGEIVQEFENGDAIFEFDVPENEHFWFGTILAFASNIQVLEPLSLIERIKLTCSEIIDQYKAKRKHC